MHAAHQQKGDLDFTAINRLHVPVAWASMLLLLGVIALGWKRARFADLGVLAAVAALAILANAFVCGALSNPHDRYGSRIAWLAPFVVLLVPWRARHDAHARPEPVDRRDSG
jgi:glycerol uptake facilitator-like aquaporin